jgi:hypothetical protein
MQNNNLEDSEILPFDIPVELYQQLLLKALENHTTTDAIAERALEMEFLRGKPYPEATEEERQKILAELAKLND